MSIQVWTFILVGLSFSIYIGIAIWSKVTTTRDFYVAGESVPSIVNGMATAADWMSAASFISMAGLISFMGRDGSVLSDGLDRWIRLTSTAFSSLPPNLVNTPCRILLAIATILRLHALWL